MDILFYWETFLSSIPVANQLDLIYVSKGTFSQALTKDCSDGYPFIHLRKLAIANIHLLKNKIENEDGSVIYSFISRNYSKLKARTQDDNAMHIIDSFTGYKF